jgi:hypothetical protein
MIKNQKFVLSTSEENDVVQSYLLEMLCGTYKYFNSLVLK